MLFAILAALTQGHTPAPHPYLVTGCARIVLHALNQIGASELFRRAG